MEKTSEETVSADELWTPIVCNDRKRMEFKKIEIESEGAKTAGKNETPMYPPVQPIPIESYSKIFKIYPFLTTPATIEEDRDRGDAGGSLNIVENGSSSIYSNSNIEGSSLLSGLGPLDHDSTSGAGTRESSSSTTRNTISGSSSRGKSPAPPGGKKPGSSFRETKINRQQRKVAPISPKNGGAKGGDYKFRGV